MWCSTPWRFAMPPASAVASAAGKHSCYQRTVDGAAVQQGCLFTGLLWSIGTLLQPDFESTLAAGCFAHLQQQPRAHVSPTRSVHSGQSNNDADTLCVVLCSCPWAVAAEREAGYIMLGSMCAAAPPSLLVGRYKQQQVLELFSVALGPTAAEALTVTAAAAGKLVT